MLESLAGKPGEGKLPVVVLAQAPTAKPENYWCRGVIPTVHYSLVCGAHVQAPVLIVDSSEGGG